MTFEFEIGAVAGRRGGLLVCGVWLFQILFKHHIMHSVLQVVLYSVTGIVVVAISNSKEIKHTYTTITGEQQAASSLRQVHGQRGMPVSLQAIQNSSYI